MAVGLRPGFRLSVLLSCPTPGEAILKKSLGWKSYPSNYLPYHLSFDKRQPLVPAEVRVGERVLVESELVQDRRVDVAEVIWFFHGVQPDRVRGADNLAAFHATAR